MGYVHEVLGKMDLKGLKGSCGIGHTRYSTTGGSLARNVQPFVGSTDVGDLALGHNGDIVNACEIMLDRQARGWAFLTSSDSELILRLLANELVDTPEVPLAMATVAKRLRGAYSLCLQVGEGVYGIRDPLGIRPLYLGHIKDGYMFASAASSSGTLSQGRSWSCGMAVSPPTGSRNQIAPPTACSSGCTSHVQTVSSRALKCTRSARRSGASSPGSTR